MVVIVWVLDLQLPMQSMPITTNVVSLNSSHGLLDTTWWFSSGTPISSTNKTDRHDITEYY